MADVPSGPSLTQIYINDKALIEMNVLAVYRATVGWRVRGFYVHYELALHKQNIGNDYHTFEIDFPYCVRINSAPFCLQACPTACE
jgi:hypothetical protein